MPSYSGTDGSNPIPSSSESGANLTSPPQAAGCIDYRVGGTATFVIDSGVRSARRPDPADRPDSTLDPDAIARTYIEILSQPRSA